MALTWREAILKNFSIRAMQNQGPDDGIHEIVPGLFLSGFKEASDAELMSRKGITHIVSLTECPTKLYANRESLVVPCKDILSQSMIEFIPRVNDFVHAARNSNGKALIHCMCGVSRGPTMTMAYLMSTANLSAQDAYNAVISVRTFICPNPSFRGQLTNYELSGALQQERNRLRAKFPVTDYTRNDEILCRERIIKCLKDPSNPFYNKFPEYYADGPRQVGGGGGGGSRGLFNSPLISGGSNVQPDPGSNSMFPMVQQPAYNNPNMSYQQQQPTMQMYPNNSNNMGAGYATDQNLQPKSAPQNVNFLTSAMISNQGSGSAGQDNSATSTRNIGGGLVGKTKGNSPPANKK